MGKLTLAVKDEPKKCGHAHDREVPGSQKAELNYTDAWV